MSKIGSKKERKKMERTARFVRALLGPVKSDIRAFAYAVDKVGELLFEQGADESDISMLRDVYPEVAKRLEKTEGAVARQVSRVSNQCWNAVSGSEELKKKYIGKEIEDIKAPGICFSTLPLLSKIWKSFYEIMEQDIH